MFLLLILQWIHYNFYREYILEYLLHHTPYLKDSHCFVHDTDQLRLEICTI